MKRSEGQTAGLGPECPDFLEIPDPFGDVPFGGEMSITYKIFNLEFTFEFVEIHGSILQEM